MSIWLYNTLTRKKEIFRPLKKGVVGLYTCGPTLHNYVHIGNLRTYIFQDALIRTLKHAGYTVRHIMNTTDVDDKTIRASKEAGTTLKAFTRDYEKAFLEDEKKLNIGRPTVLSRATEHIREMVGLIELLLKRGYAYEKEGSIYFSVEKFKRYGKLARLNREGLKVGARIDVDEYAKENAQDFVLWKRKKEGEPSWPAPFGAGRPGWHIECSAMSMKHLGSTFDMHAGGVDLIFPHHENEIAQSEAATGKPFARHWVHGEHLLVDGQKMAKSLRNFYTLRDIEAKNIDPLAYRYLVLTAHYRSKLNFTWESLAAANQSLNRLYDFVQGLQLLKSHFNRRGMLSVYKNKFKKALYDDLQTPKALAVLWDLVSDYRKDPNKFSSKEVLELLHDFDRVLGFGLKNIRSEKTPAEIKKLLREREVYRKNKDWKKADEIRDKILSLGFTVKDSPSGPKLTKN